MENETATDPFPDAPSFEEIQERKPDFSAEIEDREGDEDAVVTDEMKDWYNDAVLVAARIIVEAAREHPEFEAEFLDDESFGAAFAMDEYDEDRYQKLNDLGLSAFQGGAAESTAREILSDNDE